MRKSLFILFREDIFLCKRHRTFPGYLCDKKYRDGRMNILSSYDEVIICSAC